MNVITILILVITVFNITVASYRMGYDKGARYEQAHQKYRLDLQEAEDREAERKRKKESELSK